MIFNYLFYILYSVRIFIGGCANEQRRYFKLLSNNKKSLNKYGVKNIALFGSYVSGTATKDSDIDFLVEFKNSKKYFDNYMD